MSRLDSRYTRILKKTHIFVPKRRLEKFIEHEELRLATIEKRDGLEERVKTFGELFERAFGLDDAELKKQLGELWTADEEARLNYLIPIHRNNAETCGDGIWLPNEVAKNVLEAASRAESDINGNG
ncbi:MAG TPA: hypothetical protein PKD24_16205 [Pyrinomonadaceae bacterium]|nr:hypothetical protein [Pyrinomonadaceae bacterium]HMP66904.1 hypothetical protein [Pyrinomonadaceae bacterium]